MCIDQEKIEYESRCDGKWLLLTNTNFPADQVAIKYKGLWQVEHVFRDVKSVVDTRPVYHQRDENITGDIFCSFLALALRKEPDRQLKKSGYSIEWANIKQDLKSLQEVVIEDNGKSLALRTECVACVAKYFRPLALLFLLLFEK